MKKIMIKVLEKNVADKIAAGEIIERPLSIVKELTENSIDAGATSITVDIKQGGKDYIRITDNGCGIEEDDVEKAFLRHATSKLESVDDLNKIGTLGFRGEALASIAAVSRVSILTKTEESSSGFKLSLEGGNVLDRTKYGCPKGTTVTVKDLFYNTPAREKFLKSGKAESSAIIDFITNIALAYHNIKFRLINNENILFSTPGGDDKLKTILTLTSREFSQNLIGFSAADDEKGFKVEGYISTPGISRANRRGQIFFVNGRLVSNNTIEKSLDEAYRDRLFEGRFPMAYLFIDILPKDLDVNIHPNKTEIRFHRERDVFDFLKEGILRALISQESIPKAITEKPKVSNEIKREEKTDFIPTDIRKGRIDKSVDVKKILSNYRREKQIEETVPGMIQEEMEIFRKEQSKRDVLFSTLEVKGQIFTTYILLSGKEELFIVDQHAAQERVYFEKFLDSYKEHDKNSQILLEPFIVEVDRSAVDYFENLRIILKEAGFEIGEFGPATYIVRAVPSMFDFDDSKEFILDLVDMKDEIQDFNHEKTWNILATRACKASVKAHDKLSYEEMKALMEALDGCDNPYSCPHGRPTFLKITERQLESRFKRR